MIPRLLPLLAGFIASFFITSVFLNKNFRSIAFRRLRLAKTSKLDGENDAIESKPFILLLDSTNNIRSTQTHLARRHSRRRKRPALAFANVQIVDTYDGEVSNKAGRFVITTRKTSEVKMRASLISDETSEQTTRLTPGNTARVNFVLKETVVTFQDVVVTASAFDAVYRGEEINRLHNLHWSEVWRGWLMKSSLSLNRYGTQRHLGN